MVFRKFIPVAILVAAGIIYFSVNSWAHGVSYEMVETSPAVTFRSGFSSGEPIAYGEVLIYSPDDSEVEFQNGRTDKNGVFSFLPDRPGIWKIEVKGGLGHKLMFEVQVDAHKIIKDSKADNYGFLHSSQSMRAVLGVSLLFNIALATLLLRARKRKKLNKIN